jgi:hypothetical protein
MLISITFPNLNSIHLIIKKDKSLDVLFRSNYMLLFPPKKHFLMYFCKYSFNIIQIQPFYEVDTSLYRPKRCISTEDVVRGRYTSLGRYTTCID